MKKPDLRRILCLALALLMLGSLALSALAAETEDIIIDSAQDLLDLAKSCTLDTWSQGKTVVLTTDISWKGWIFSPSPPSAAPLTARATPSAAWT